MRFRTGTGDAYDETGELAESIRAQQLARSRRALIQARLQVQKVGEFLPEGAESKITQDDLSLEQIDEALARFEERLAQMSQS